MSYMRGRFYVWGDGEKIHLWIRDEADDVSEYVHDCEFVAGVAIPEAIFDDLALQHMARLTDEGRLAEAKARWLEQNQGTIRSAWRLDNLLVPEDKPGSADAATDKG